MLQASFSNQVPFRSSDIDETIEHCSQLIWPHRMQVERSGSLESSFSGFNADPIGIVCVGYGADVIIDAGDIEEYFLIQHKLSGEGKFSNGKAETDTEPGMTTIASPSLPTTLKMDINSVHVVMKLKRTLLENYLQNILQRTLSDPVVFDLKMESGSAAAKAWEQTLQYFIEQYVTLQDEDQAGLARIFAESAIGLLLQIQNHNYSELLNKDSGNCCPSYVRRAQEFIEENITEQINMATLASITGVTVRTLQNGFRRHLGQSPTEYIREHRLQRVHKELSHAEANEKVTEVLLRCGIYDFGRFAGAYKKRYGCLPSDTLKYRSLL